MNPLVRPFRALRPRPEHAAAVIAPPYDVVSYEEALALVRGRPSSFLHISRPEIDLPAGTDPHSDAVYSRGAENLARLTALGILVRDAAPSFYAYRLETATHRQTGIALTASVAAYEENRVRRHELTRPDKEADRVRNIEALNAETGPVLCAHRADATVKKILDEACGGTPLFEVEGQHAVMHSVWRIDAPNIVAALGDALNALGALYIADGHHRSAAAARVAAERRGKRPDPDASPEFFLAVTFPDDELEILSYNRIVTSLNGLEPQALIERLAASFSIERAEAPVAPEASATFGMYLASGWYRLTLHRALLPNNDPVAKLDVSLLTRHVIEPVLGIEDQRTDPRIGFVGGIRGLSELEQHVDSGRAAVAFALYPTRVDQLMAVADANALMPPKSTWFEPKLADGLLTHVLD
jgi:uncharacterized protein (DUF1015 family)